MNRTILFTGLALDRADTVRRDANRLAELASHPESRFLPAWNGRALIDDPPRAHRLTGAAVQGLLEQGCEPVFLGLEDGAACFALDLSHLTGGENGPDLGLSGGFQPLRQVAAVLPGDDAALLAYARGLLYWHTRQRFCGVCGGPTRSDWGGHVRTCVAEGCAVQHFPRTDPAVIVLVTDGDHCLLGRQTAWPKGMYSCLAGFVEPGETLEETVAREVYEEARVTVSAAHYVASQPWPFPSSLMLGFFAEGSGQPSTESKELEDVRWFHRDELPRFKEQGLFLPRRESIARHLVDAWREGGRG